MSVPCPACRRSNAPHRETCLYCGRALPTPTVPPPPRTRELPANLDELIRKAMRGGDVAALKRALDEGRAEPAAAAQAASVPSPAGGGPSAAQAASVPSPAGAGPSASPAGATLADPPAASADPWDSLVAEAQAARAARSDPGGRAAALDRLVRLAERLRAEGHTPDVPDADELAEAIVEPLDDAPEAPPPPDDGPPVRLPPARHPWALALEAVPAGMEVGRLAAALEVDLATARAAALAGGTRVVLRAPERPELERRAEALRGLGIRARVLSREELLIPPPALALVGVDSLDRWRVAPVGRWGEVRPDPSQLPTGSVVVPAPIRLVVAGEVEEKRLRAPAPDSRWQRAHYAAPNGAGGETRIAVWDLHSDEACFRVVEGAADLRPYADRDGASQRLALRAFLDAVVLRWPAAIVEPRRTFPASPRPGEPLRAHGWAAFEEASRVCRALYVGPHPDG